MDLTWLWKILIGTIFVAATSLSAWTINTIAEIPKEYTPLEEFKELRKENREDHKELIEKIDRISKQLDTHSNKNMYDDAL